jgi:hypothetical protein
MVEVVARLPSKRQDGHFIHEELFGLLEYLQPHPWIGLMGGFLQ